ncbi:MAG: hypothetical protein C0453_03000 [Comamonadaceae bacterium]|nr:hypothetical protein [Comamonadaceae bacterium]
MPAINRLLRLRYDQGFAELFRIIADKQLIKRLLRRICIAHRPGDFHFDKSKSLNNRNETSYSDTTDRYDPKGTSGAAWLRLVLCNSDTKCHTRNKAQEPYHWADRSDSNQKHGKRNAQCQYQNDHGEVG